MKITFVPQFVKKEKKYIYYHFKQSAYVDKKEYKESKSANVYSNQIDVSSSFSS